MTQWRSFSTPTIGNFSMDYPHDWQSQQFAAGNRGDDELIALFYATDSMPPLMKKDIYIV
jgi:hypothetical protein